jgi:hypothetical protein
VLDVPYASRPRITHRLSTVGVAGLLAIGAATPTAFAAAPAPSTGHGKHVLVLSVAGMHQSDLTW